MTISYLIHSDETIFVKRVTLVWIRILGLLVAVVCQVVLAKSYQLLIMVVLFLKVHTIKNRSHLVIYNIYFLFSFFLGGGGRFFWKIAGMKTFWKYLYDELFYIYIFICLIQFKSGILNVIFQVFFNIYLIKVLCKNAVCELVQKTRCAIFFD